MAHKWRRNSLRKQKEPTDERGEVKMERVPRNGRKMFKLHYASERK